jgi:hypothetical protein
MTIPTLIHYGFTGHGNDSDTEGTHRGELMQEPSLTAAGVH